MNYEEYKQASPDDKFNYFMQTLIPTNHTPHYFVNWRNVDKHVTEAMKINLNTMNYLIGADNIAAKAKALFKKQVELVSLIPVLLASRDGNIDIFNLDNFTINSLNFAEPDQNKIDDYVDFMQKTGLLDFMQHKLQQSLVDFVFGVQTGLDSNGRKNRSGTQNEIILEHNLQELVNKHSVLAYATQATRTYIKKVWSIAVPENLDNSKKGGRRYDGAVYNLLTDKVTIIETNFYSGGGSKLKAVAGEFSDMYERALSQDLAHVNFVWISDGAGWQSAKNPMREAFDVIPNIFNLMMVKNGFLDAVVMQ